MYSKTEKNLNRLSVWTGEYSEIQRKKLHNLSQSKNSDVRAQVARLLACETDAISENVLYHLSFDRSEIVQIEAIDSLAMGSSEMTLQRLNTLMDSDNDVIRQFALASYVDVYLNRYGQNERSIEKLTKQMKTLYFQEKSERVRMVICKIRYLCGESEMFEILLETLLNSIKLNRYDMISPLLYIIDEILDDKMLPRFTQLIQPYFDLLDEHQRKIIRV